MVVGFAIASTAHLAEPTAAPGRLGGVLPAPVIKLSQWTSEAVMAGPNRVLPSDDSLGFVKLHSLQWIRETFAVTWQPASLEPVFIRSEFDGRVVVRARWECQGFTVEVSQTASILVIKLAPQDGSGTGLDPTQRLLQARSIAARIFPVSGERRTDQGEIVPVEALNQEIVARSFGGETARRLEDDGVVVGGPVARHPEGIFDDQGRAFIPQDTPPRPEDWLLIILSASHWSETVCWWNDGQSMGIYLHKHAGDSTIPDFGKPRDRYLFRGRPKVGASLE
jgi:hypothetical protein